MTASAGRRFGAFIFALVVILVLAPLGLTRARAVGVTPDPDHVGFTLEGCKDPSAALPDGSNRFVCPAGDYTTGNLGKTWNELDLVPYRITASAGGAAPAVQTYAVSIVVDNMSGAKPGYDVISEPVLNLALSDAGCLPSVASPSGGAGAISVSGSDKSLYRILTITQAQSTDCVYDFYARLALGSHTYPGSSLHANLWSQNLSSSGIGSHEVSIPVNAILPQTISKDMAATQGSDHIWDVTKTVAPTLDFANTCGVAANRTMPLSVTIEWHRLAASPSGDITVLTHVYADNPSHRLITTQVTDKIYSGLTQIGPAVVGSAVDVPAGSVNFLVLTSTVTVPAGTTNLNDIATATYTDKVTGIAVPGTTTATASATSIGTGSTTNATASIADVITIAGAGLSYSVDTVTSGSIASYTLGTSTTSPLTWASGSLSGDGSATLGLGVHVGSPGVYSGTLSDTATLTGSDGFTTDSSAGTAITTHASDPTITVHKTVDIAPTSDTTFSFTIHPNSGGSDVNTTVKILAGATSGDSATMSVPVSAGGYVVTETNVPTGYTGAAPTNVGALGYCDSTTATIANTRNLASLSIHKTASGGVGDETFTFGVDCDGTAYDVNPVTVGSNATVVVESVPTGTSCTVTEAIPTGWTLTSTNGLVVVVPDGGATASFTNVRNTGALVINKTAQAPDLSPFDGTFTYTIDCTDGHQTFGPVTRSITTSGGSGQATVAGIPTGLVCTVTEDHQSGVWTITSSDSQTATIGSGNGVHFVNTRDFAPIYIDKTATGGLGSETFTFSLDCDGTAYDKNNITVTSNGGPQQVASVPTGTTCTVTEAAKTGWTLTSANGVSVSAGGTASFTNVRDTGALTINKTVSNPADGGDATFAFIVSCDDGAGETFDANVDVVVVAGIGSATVTGIPTGLTCTVTEAAATGYRIDSQNPQVVTSSATFSVAYVNTKETVVLGLDKSASPSGSDDLTNPPTVLRGQRITYTLEYSNHGNTATDAELTDEVPAGTTYDASTQPTCDPACTVAPSYDAATHLLSFGVHIDAGGSGTVTFAATVNADAADGDVIRNVGHLKQTGGGDPGIDSNPVRHQVFVPTEDLALVKKVDKSVAKYGDRLTYTFVAKNTGQADQDGVVVSDELPAGTSYVAGSAACAAPCTASYDASLRTVTWELNKTLASGADSTPLTFVVTIDLPTAAADGAIPATTIVNVGLVGSNTVPRRPSNPVKTPVVKVLGIKVVRPLPETGSSLPIALTLQVAAALLALGAGFVGLAQHRRRRTAE